MSTQPERKFTISTLPWLLCVALLGIMLSFGASKEVAAVATPNAALTVTKTRTSPASTVTPGTPVTFVIDIANSGGVNLPTVRLRDRFSDGCLLLTSTSQPLDVIWSTIGNGEATWNNIGALAVGQHKVITTTFTTRIAMNNTFPSQPFNCVDTANEAIAEALGDPNTVVARASASAVVSVSNGQVSNGAALSVTKTRTSAASTVTPGTAVTFLIEIANTGSVNLPMLRVRDHFNDGCLLLSSASPTYNSIFGTIGNGEATWNNIGALAVGQHVAIMTTFTSHIARDAQGIALNCANTPNEVTVEGLSDPNTVMAQASATAHVSVIELETITYYGTPALTVSKRRTSPASVVTPGTPVTFVIDVANTGDVPLTTVRVRDHFNDGCLLLGQASPTYDAIFGTIGNGEATWNNVGPLAVGQHKVITTTFNTRIAMDNSFPSQPFNCVNTSNEATAEALLGDTVVTQGSDSATVSVSNGQIITLLVAPFQDLCTGGFFIPFPCLQTRTTSTGAWVGMPEPIAGFHYQLGTDYELRVLKETLPNPPADAFPYRYTLVEIVRATDLRLQDSDGDGMIDGAEISGPNNGDGNNDGTPDYQQTNVASTLDAFDSSYVAVEATGNCSSVDQLTSVPHGSGPTDRNYHQPRGAVRFELTCPQPGQSATVSFYWHGIGDPSNLRFRKYGPTTPGNPATIAWYDYPATFSVVQIPDVGPNGEPLTRSVVKVTLTLTDGQLGDSTGLDGKIVDPGAIAIGSPDVQLKKTLNTRGVLHPGQPISFTIAITNSSGQLITTLPLTDTYDSTYLSFDSVNGAQPATVDNADDGRLNWSNVLAVGGLAPGASRTIVVYFSTKLETTSSTGCAGALGTTCNVASLDAGISGVAVSPLEVTIAPTPGKSSVGDFVWHDWDGDGQQDANEPGINGVRVNLYEDRNNNNQIDSGEFITYTVTANNGSINGFYQFATVTGNRQYLVTIDASNFAAGGALLGYVFSNDKNTVPTSSSERQQSFLLGNPENKSDVDFPLYCKFDLALVKTLAAGQSSTIQPGNHVTFTLTVFNQGVVTATNISLVDYLPSGFTLNAAASSGWTSNGVTATLTVPGVVSPNSSRLVNIVLTAGANLTGVYTNTAEISGAVAPGNTPLPDFDSTPDRTNRNGSNGNTGESTALVDNQTTGNGKVAGQDEDDHDIATVTVATARYVISKKLVTASPAALYSPVTFTIAITNTGSLSITALPLRDLYQLNYLTYQSATPPADDLVNDGQIDWSDLTTSFGRALQPGQAFRLQVRFQALRDTTALPGGVTVNNARAYNARTTTTIIPDPPPVTATVRILAPTAVEFANVNAHYANGQVTLTWQTVSEVEAVSFNVLRQAGKATDVSASAEWVKLNAAPIPAQQPGQASGASYRYVDATVTAGQSYRYQLEITDSSGQSTYRDLGALLTGRNAIYLAVVAR